MGTPPFAVPALEGLVKGGYDLAAVYTQPDRPAGRSRVPVPSPVKRAAVRLGLSIRQPRSLRRAEEQERLRELAPDLLVVAAYGLILPQAVLNIPTYGGLNVHPSLLPRHRGASPVVGALLAGDRETGVSIMLMDAGMDTGPVLTQAVVAIEPGESAQVLTERLAEVGAGLLLETIPRWTSREVEPQPQDDQKATYTRLLTKEDGVIDWSQPADAIVRRVLAYYPWPGSATFWQGKRLEVLVAEAFHAEVHGDPGTVVQPEGRRDALVTTGEGALALKRVQLEGKRAMNVEEFLQGARGFVGSLLGRGGA